MKKLFIVIMLAGCVTGTQQQWHLTGSLTQSDFYRDKNYCGMESMKIRPTLHPEASFWGNSQTVYYKKCLRYKGYTLR